MIDRRWILAVGAALLFSWSVGMFARGFWTPDEPREADLAWRMSWQESKAVPLLAGDPFCEKPRPGARGFPISCMPCSPR
jgi:4-amino-4-deoxy-L-arabinose transferase-like glycosyltransferase